MRVVVPVTWEIPEKLRDRFGDGAGRQRAMLSDGHLILVLHGAPCAQQRDREARIFWREPAGAWTSNSSGSGTQALKSHLSEFTQKLEQLEKQFESASCADDYFLLLQDLSPLHRTSRHLHSTLQQAREMLPDDRDLIVFRDIAGDVERALELLYTDAKNGLEYTVAHKTELQSKRSYEMAVSAHRLNILAAVFFPITAISSIFGMNIHHGLETASNGWTFWVILAVGFFAGLLLTKIMAAGPEAATTSETSLSKKRFDTGASNGKSKGNTSRRWQRQLGF